MIVDDSRLIRRQIFDRLTARGYTVVAEAGSAEDALEKLSECQADVVTLDLTLPGMDGITAVSEILSVSPHSRVVVISAVSSRDIKVEAAAAGARGFVEKPFTDEDLVSAIEQSLSI